LQWDGGDPNSGDIVSYEIYIVEVGCFQEDLWAPESKLGEIGPFPGFDTDLEYQIKVDLPLGTYDWGVISTDSRGETRKSPRWRFQRTIFESTKEYLEAWPDYEYIVYLI